MPEFDVVVAGGGPAGLQFARELGHRTDYSVAVLEANDALSDNDKSTGGTFEQVIDGFSIPGSVIMSSNPGVLFEGPTAGGRLALPNYVLDFPAFLEYLGADAAEAGVEIHTGTRVQRPLTKEQRVVGVEATRGGERLPYRADLVVDATGPAGTLTESLGMWDPDAAQRGIGKEFEVEGRYSGSDMLFRFDHEWAPGGYAWTFPAGEGVYKAGVCWIDDFYERHSPPEDGSIDEYVRAWVESDDRWEAGEVRAVHAGRAVVDNSINTRARDGIVAVGDAVSSINPLFGEGIRPGMESARMAADAAVDAFAVGELTHERLVRYERRWNRQKGPRWKLQRIVGELLYDFTPGQQDRFVRSVGDLSLTRTRRLQAYALTLRDLLGLYPVEVRDLAKVPRLLRHVR